MEIVEEDERYDIFMDCVVGEMPALREA